MRFLVFLCKKCGVELTDFLQELSPESLVFYKGEAAVSKTRYMKVKEPWTYEEFVEGRRSHSRRGFCESEQVVFQSGDYLLNILDVDHKIARGAFPGCCGWHPTDELNAECVNGHKIGAVHSDECWSSLVCRLS